MQNERPIGDSPSLRAVTAKIEMLSAANPKATHKARFKMLSKWLEDNPEHQKSVNAYFLTATHQLSHDGAFDPAEPLIANQALANPRQFAKPR
jgi:hypothetical protein